MTNQIILDKRKQLQTEQLSLYDFNTHKRIKLVILKYYLLSCSYHFITMSKDHFNPSLLTKRFAGTDGKLWYFNRHDESRGIQHKKPEKIFYERNLDLSADGAETNQQHFNKTLETPFSILLDKIFPKIRAGSNITLSEAERFLLMRFTFVQYKRRPEILRDLLNEEEVIRESTEHDLSEIDTTVIRQILESQHPNHKDFLHDVRRKMIAEENPEALKEFSKSEFYFSHNIFSDPLAICSRPIARHSVDVRIDSEDFTGEVIVFPLASDIALLIAEDRIGLEGSIASFTKRADIRSINSKNWERSQSIASRSKEQITRLTKCNK